MTLAAALIANKILVKAHGGGNPNHDDLGRFAESPGGGAGGGGVGGGKYPHAPGHKEVIADDDLRAANNHLRALQRGGSGNDDPDVREARDRVVLATKELNRLRMIRTNDKMRQMGTGDVALDHLNANPKPVDQFVADRTRRAMEAARLATAAQAARRAGQSFEERVAASTGVDRQGRTYNQFSQSSDDQQRDRPSGSGLTGAIGAATSRISRAARNISNVMSNIQGIASTSDYSVMGGHLNLVQRELTSLHDEIRALPADAKRLKRELTTSFTRLSAAATRLTSRFRSANAD